MQRMPKVINKKRLVRYKEGAEMYSMGMNKFQTLAKDAGAILKIDRMVLVDLDVFDQYLESFCRQGKRFWFNQNSLDFWLNRKYNDYEMDGGVYCG